MPLEIGTRLAHYEVTALIGEGGMGQVYQATDTKLNRQVALKILPEAFATDPDRLARFQREAQVLASLNHPNIAQIHGIEEDEDTRALVLELVEGPTLADRIAQGPIPLDEALPIAKQIAEALEAAHEAGVIHRDLKPANIKVREDGTVKVLDFGLAKALDPSPTGDPSESPTLTASATQMGVIMGTAAYMSPEQASGTTADKRADIWSFGVVFFEMLTGERMFTGETVPHVLASVLRVDPDWTTLPTETPAAIRTLLQRCLAKDRRRRVPDIGMARIEIDDAITRPAGDVTNAVAVPRLRVWQRPMALVAGAVALLVLTGLTVWNLRPAPAPLAGDAFAVVLPGDTRLPDMPVVAALSPDGRHLVYVGERAGATQLYHRPLDQVDAVPIADTDGATFPFFSPDGEWVGFRVGTTLKRVQLTGGPSVTVCVLPDRGFARAGAWSEDDTIWFGSPDTGLYQVAATGGVPQLVTTLDAANDGELGHIAPQPLPDGRAILYSVYRGGFTNPSIAIYVPGTGEQRTLTDGMRPWFASSGHIVFSGLNASAGSDGTLWALPFDVDRLEPTGEAVRVREGVRAGGIFAAQSSLGMDGTLVYVPAGASTNERTLVWVTRNGDEEPLPLPSRPFREPRISPDGTRVAVVIPQGNGSDIWIYDLTRGGSEIRLTRDPGQYRYPLWNPGGDRVLFAFDPGGQPGALFWKAADGTGEAERLHSEPERLLGPYSWSADGSTLVLSEVVSSAGYAGYAVYEIGVLTMAGERTWAPLLQEADGAWQPVVSPDGRWLAYGSNDSGEQGIYIRPFPNMDGRRLGPISLGPGANHPVWSPDGGELFYRDGVALMSVSVETEPELSAGIPEVLFEDTYFRRGLYRDYEVAADGRFLMIKVADIMPHRQINVVRNWVGELIERVPIN